MTERASPTTALAIALAWGSVGAVALYATLRLGQVALTNEPFPTAVLVSGSVAYFWRGATAIFGGVLLAFGAFVLAREDGPRAARPLPHAVVAVACYLAFQALVAP